MLPGKEIKSLKEELQSEIITSILKFMDKSGIYISDIDIKMIDVSKIDGKAEYAVGNIIIKMEV